MDEGRSNEMTTITLVFMWGVIIALLLLFGCAGRKYHPKFPNMIIIKESTQYSCRIEVCRFEADGLLICEGTLDSYKDKVFYGFPKSEFERAEKD